MTGNAASSWALTVSQSIFRKGRASFTQFQQILRTELAKFGKHRRPSLRRFETDSLPERRLDHLLLRRHREVRNASPRNGGFVFHLFILLFFLAQGGERQSASWASAAAIRASISLISSCKVALRSTASSSNSDCFMSLVSNSRHTFRWCSIRAHNCAPFLGLVCQLHRKRNFLFLRSGHKGRLVFLVVLWAHDLLQKCNEPTSRWERGQQNQTQKRQPRQLAKAGSTEESFAWCQSG